MRNYRRSHLNQVIQYLKRTLPEMNKRRIPATPENYAVWYEYISGHNPKLSSTIDSYIKENVEFTEKLNATLYKNYIENEKNAALEKIQVEVRSLIEELLSSVGTSGKDLTEYGSVLEKFTQQMERENNIDIVRKLVSDLILQTKSQEESTRSMKQSLKTMAEEIHSLRKEIENLSVASATDPLTHAANRATFDSELAHAAQLSEQEETPLSLVIFDIDHFKKINDKFGHLAGDKVLKFVSSTLKKNTKGKDTVARFGGEEFALVLPDTDYSSAIAVAENIRKRIGMLNLTDSMENRQIGTITVSAGVAIYKHDESTDTLIHRADECLYAAKREGRDLVKGEREVDTYH